jgi:hypothetical protein
MEEDTDGDDTQVLIGAGQEVNTQEEAQDDLQGKANYWWNSIENRIQALLSMDTPWSLEKADSLVQWRDKVSTKTENGDNPTPMAAWLQWSEEAGPNWMATGHTDSEEKWEHGKTEYDDYFTAEGETRDVSYNKMPNGLFRPDRHWAKRNSKARFVIGKFMSQVKEIVSKKEMSNTEKNWKIGNLMHKTIVSCYDKQWSIGDFKGYLHGTGCSSLKWEGAWLRTDVLLRSIVFWVTKNKDLSYSWKGNNGEMAWSNGQPVKNKFSDKIGELYNLKGFVPLQDFLKNDCMGYYLMK